MSRNIVAIEAETTWCNPHNKNRLSEKVQCDLIKLDEETVKKCRAAGVNVNFDTTKEPNDPEFKGYWIRPKADTAVPTKDMNGNVIPPTVLIGNNSKVIAGVEFRPWTHQDSGKSGVKIVWLGLRVRELVPYDPDKAARDAADAVLDEASGGEGFEFGEAQQASEEDFDALFGDDND